MRCEKCGAKLLHRRVMMGVPKPEEFVLTAEENSVEEEKPGDEDAWQFPPKAEIKASAEAIVPERETKQEIRWGGFFRRAIACIVDVIVLALLGAIMGAMAYVGYKVGLAAHGRTIAWDNVPALVAFFVLGWLGLTTTYFIVFHGMSGKTIGKSLLSLRVVGAEQRPIDYRQAAIRWLATVGFAPVGIGFLWVLWQREKRGWHDFVARTWVIRD
jgi:uncharacterized RDD family membrane protein YckC